MEAIYVVVGLFLILNIKNLIQCIIIVGAQNVVRPQCLIDKQQMMK